MLAGRRRWRRRGVDGPAAGDDERPAGAALLPGDDRRGGRWAGRGVRRALLGVAGVALAVLAVVAIVSLPLDQIAARLGAADLGLVLVALFLMALSPFVRAAAWRVILGAALPGERLRRVHVLQAYLVGLLMSAMLPARVGEPARAFVLARRTSSPREVFSTALGTVVSQSLLNVLALVVLGAAALVGGRLASASLAALPGALLVLGLVALAVVLIVALPLLQLGAGRVGWFDRAVGWAIAETRRVRGGLTVYARPRQAAVAVGCQLAGWALQWLACWALLRALGLSGEAGASAAAGVLFAVNVTAAVPLVPSNVGVFQAATVAVLSGAYGVSVTDAIAYGVILQALEVVTSLALGLPALVREGLSWDDVRRGVEQALQPSGERARAGARTAVRADLSPPRRSSAPATRTSSSGLRIAMVSPYDLTPHGGVNVHIRNLRLALMELGHSVRVYGPSSDPGRLQEGEQALGRAIAITLKGTTAGMNFNLALGRRVRRILARERFDIVHLHEPGAPILPWLFAANAHVPLVGTCHIHREGGHRIYAIFRWLLHHWFERLDARIAVSHAARGTHERYFPGDYQVIPNGVHVQRFRGSGADGRTDGRTVLFVGRLESRKGVRCLIDAMPALRERVPGARLVVAGEGPERKSLERRAAKVCPGVVRFIGMVPNDALPAVYAAADVVCSPATHGESFGIVLLEAMAAGRPIVASRLEGFETVVTDDETAELVPPGDAAALAEGLAGVLTDTKRRASLVATASRHVQPYDWSQVARRVERVYVRALHQQAVTASAYETTLVGREVERGRSGARAAPIGAAGARTPDAATRGERG
jgi:glycosyltransferase involved in cell wall biosynthesis